MEIIDVRDADIIAAVEREVDMFDALVESKTMMNLGVVHDINLKDNHIRLSGLHKHELSRIRNALLGKKIDFMRKGDCPPSTPAEELNDQPGTRLVKWEDLIHEMRGLRVRIADHRTTDKVEFDFIVEGELRFKVEMVDDHFKTAMMDIRDLPEMNRKRLKEESSKVELDAWVNSLAVSMHRDLDPIIIKERVGMMTEVYKKQVADSISSFEEKLRIRDAN